MQSRLLILLIILLIALPTIAQDDTEPEPETTPEPLPIPAQLITIDAADGLDLVADFYLLDPANPTVILLHEIYKDRTSWNQLLLPLIANGYNILTPDIRGGWGDTRGSINWFKAVDDVEVWFTWLREEAGVNPELIHTIGSSMGSSLAIVGCANDELCRSAIAISPGWNYYRINIGDSITVRPVLGIYAENDRWPALGIPQMLDTAPDLFSAIAYEGNAHGMNLFANEQETIVVAIIEWLNAH
jgi:pimeloyl-ACP methyl ester carboxylesterase